MTMFFPLHWREETIPILLVKDKNIFGCKLRGYGHPLTLPRWFGGLHGFKDFGLSLDRPYSSSNEFVFSCFEIAGSFVARTYLLMLVFSVLGTLTAVFYLDVRILLLSLFLGAVYLLYPELCFWSYQKYMVDIPANNGWIKLAITDEESLNIAYEAVGDHKRLDIWLTDPGIQSFKLHHHI